MENSISLLLTPRSEFTRYIAHVCLGILSLVVVLSIAGAAYQTVESLRDRRLNPPPGRLVNVDGHKTHIDCIGEGSPTVILEAGLADTWLAWYKVQPEVSKFTRVCSYDRAGMGWSDSSPKPRNAKVIATQLNELLHNAGIDPPFVMVGHSLGGLYVRMYTDLYPADVVGMVLVDAAHPDQYERLSPGLKKSNDEFLRKEGWKLDTMPLGIPRLLGWCGSGPVELRPMLRTVDCGSGPWREHMAEYKSWDVNADQVRATKSLGNMPLIVLSHDPERGTANSFDEVWNEMQVDLSHISTNSTQILVAGSSHAIQIDRPDAVTAAIRKVVDESRNPRSNH